jgi:hypothetical protein
MDYQIFLQLNLKHSNVSEEKVEEFLEAFDKLMTDFWGPQANFSYATPDYEVIPLSDEVGTELRNFLREAGEDPDKYVFKD